MFHLSECFDTKNIFSPLPKTGPGTAGSTGFILGLYWHCQLVFVMLWCWFFQPLQLPNTAGPTPSLCCYCRCTVCNFPICFASRHGILTVNRRSCVCWCPCALLLSVHDILIKPQLLNNKVSVKQPQNPGAPAWFGAGRGFVELLVLPRSHRWTWGCLHSEISEIWCLHYIISVIWCLHYEISEISVIFVSVARATVLCGNQGFWGLWLFIFVSVWSQSWPGQQRKVLPPLEISATFYLCLFLLPRGSDPPILSENCRQENTLGLSQSLVLSLVSSAWALS